MVDQVHLPDNPEIAKNVLEKDLQKRQLGVLGRVFGSNQNTSTHIVGLLLILLVIAGIAYTFFTPAHQAFAVSEFWKVLSPIITTIIGYFLGTNSRRESP